jgi:hypothetical protein
MKLRLAVGSVLVAFVTLGAGSSLLGQEGALRYRWTKGDVTRYRVVQTTNAAMSGIPGMGEMNVTNTMTQVQQFTTTDVGADGAGTLQVKFESIKMEMGTPMGTFTYDSTAPSQNPDPMVAQLGATIGALVGESLTLVMSPNGAIQKMDGMTRIMEKMQKNTPAAGGMGMAGLDSLLTDESMKGAFGQSFAHLPGTAVKTGDSWKHDLVMPNPFGTMNVATLYSLKGVESTGGKELARIASTATITASPSAKPPAMPMPVTIQFADGTGDGEIIFDRRAGRTQRSTFNTTMPMSMNMTAPDGSTLNISALTKTTMMTELIEK